jgi:hypothetical protein
LNLGVTVRPHRNRSQPPNPGPVPGLDSETSMVEFSAKPRTSMRILAHSATLAGNLGYAGDVPSRGVE